MSTKDAFVKKIEDPIDVDIISGSVTLSGGVTLAGGAQLDAFGRKP